MATAIQRDMTRIRREVINMTSERTLLLLSMEGESKLVIKLRLVPKQ